MHLRSTRAASALAVLNVMATVVVCACVRPAGAAVDQAVRDPRDAHPALDIRKVEVTHNDKLVKLVVSVRDFARMDSAASVPTSLGVHFDVSGDAEPEHLIRIDGFHYVAGSTSGWNSLNYNGMDPFGDWTDCYPNGWDKPLIQPRPASNKVVFRAPRTCLGDAGSVRVSVQSYKPYEETAKTDWVRGVRRYLGPRIDLT